jgi:hypothetical protein
MSGATQRTTRRHIPEDDTRLAGFVLHVTLRREGFHSCDHTGEKKTKA